MTTTTSPTHWRGIRAPRTLGMFGAALLIVASTFVASSLRTTPRDGGTPGGAAPASTLALSGDAAAVPAIGSLAQIDHSIDAWAKNLADNPKDFISATNLATLYHARGRLTGDLDDQTRALEATRTAERLAPSQTSGAALEAAILYTLHDFAGSRAIADRLYRANPADLGSLAMRADDELELGLTSAARADYAVVAAAATGPAVDIRLARLAYLTGDPAAALARAVSARDAAAGDPEADHGFYDYAVGEYARFLGDTALARASYSSALAVRSTDFASLVGLAKVDAATGRVPAAIAEAEQAAAIVPQPETLTLLGDLRTISGDPSGAADAYATVRAIRTLSAIEGTVFDRQLALFDLDHGGATMAILATAQASLAERSDAAGHDLVAWAAFRLGRVDLAQREMGIALGSGIQDARILEHAGAIAIAAGDLGRGEALLRTAISLGPALDPRSTVEATKLLGE